MPPEEKLTRPQQDTSGRDTVNPEVAEAEEFVGRIATDLTSTDRGVIDRAIAELRGRANLSPAVFQRLQEFEKQSENVAEQQRAQLAQETIRAAGLPTGEEKLSPKDMEALVGKGNGAAAAFETVEVPRERSGGFPPPTVSGDVEIAAGQTR